LAIGFVPFQHGLKYLHTQLLFRQVLGFLDSFDEVALGYRTGKMSS